MFPPLLRQTDSRISPSRTGSGAVTGATVQKIWVGRYHGCRFPRSPGWGNPGGALSSWSTDFAADPSLKMQKGAHLAPFCSAASPADVGRRSLFSASILWLRHTRTAGRRAGTSPESDCYSPRTGGSQGLSAAASVGPGIPGVICRAVEIVVHIHQFFRGKLVPGAVFGATHVFSEEYCVPAPHGP